MRLILLGIFICIILGTGNYVKQQKDKINIRSFLIRPDFLEFYINLFISGHLLVFP